MTKCFDIQIVQTLTTKGGVKTIEQSASSLTIGVEFDIVVMNKAHTIEVRRWGVRNTCRRLFISNTLSPRKGVRVREMKIRMPVFRTLDSVFSWHHWLRLMCGH